MAETLVLTADGSKTLYHAGVGEHYHSRHGAVGESRHVFLGMGLKHHIAALQNPDTEPLSPQQTRSASVLEIGFGTGLNFVLSADYAEQNGFDLDYVGVEAFPLPIDTIRQMDYGQYVLPEVWQDFLGGYQDALSKAGKVHIGSNGRLRILHQPILNVGLDEKFDVIYFDAFAAIHQPDMWSLEVLAHVCAFLKTGGVFVTYAITGDLKRSLKRLGFSIEKLPGAPGKREMLRAVKL